MCDTRCRVTMLAGLVRYTCHAYYIHARDCDLLMELMMMMMMMMMMLTVAIAIIQSPVPGLGVHLYV